MCLMLGMTSWLLMNQESFVLLMIFMPVKALVNLDMKGSERYLSLMAFSKFVSSSRVVLWEVLDELSKSEATISRVVHGEQESASTMQLLFSGI